MKLVLSIVAGLIAGYIGGYLGYQTGSHLDRDSVSDVLRARKFELIAGSGQRVSSWTVDERPLLPLGRSPRSFAESHQPFADGAFVY